MIIILLVESIGYFIILQVSYVSNEGETQGVLA